MRALKLFIFLAIFPVSFAGVAFAEGPNAYNSYVFDGPSSAYRIQNSFSAAGSGLNSVNSNPATIVRSPTFEVSFGYGADLASHAISTLTVSDEDMGSIGGDNSFFSAGLFFTDDLPDAPTNEFKTRDVKVKTDYDHGGGLTDFGVAFNFGKVFAFGVTRQRPAIFDIELAGYCPTIFRGTINMLGQTMYASGQTLEVQPDGKAVFTGTGTSFVTSDSLWPEFTNNSSDAAMSSTINVADKATDSREIVLTIGGSFGNLFWGVNAIPINSNIVLNNYMISQVSSTAANMVYHVPYFTDEAQAYEWYASGNYSREAGYRPYTFVLSPGATVELGVAAGNYSASAMRVDLGFIWQLTNDLSLSMVYENIGGANLIYKGKGVESTIESYINRDTVPSFEPGSGGSWNPLTNTPEAIEGAKGFYLPEEFTVNLPRKGKLGLAFNKPFFFAIDYERYFSDIIYDGTTVKDLAFLKVGMESQIFALPLVFRVESNWLLKPTILGITDPKAVKDLNDFLNTYPALPTETKFGLGLKIAGGELGGDFMENHASLLAIYQGNMMDFMKVLSYDLYFRTDNWDITYTAVAEPFYLLAQNAELLNETKDGETITAEQVKTNFVYSLKFGLRF